MIEGRTIRGLVVDAESFRRGLGSLSTELQKECLDTLSSLIFKQVETLPQKLHFHQLKDKEATSRRDSKKKVPIWSLHLTANDAYKGSFTFEDCVMYMRVCDTHKIVDKTP